jgi:hypothetical protein
MFCPKQNIKVKLVPNNSLFRGVRPQPVYLCFPFSSKGKNIAQGSTHNLMDYTTKQPDNILRKYQWYVIHNPRLSLFGGAEEEVSEGDIKLHLQAKNTIPNMKYELHIYDPELSRIFEQAIKDNDILRQRAIALYARTHSLTDKVNIAVGIMNSPAAKLFKMSNRTEGFAVFLYY